MNLPPPPTPDDSRAFRDWCYRVYAAISGNIDMASTLRELIPTTVLAVNAAPYYTATKCTARVDNLTITNTDAVGRTVSVYLVAAGGTANTGTLVIKNASIAAGATFNGTELVGKIISPGSSIWLEPSAAGVLVANAGGIEVT